MKSLSLELQKFLLRRWRRGIQPCVLWIFIGFLSWNVHKHPTWINSFIQQIIEPAAWISGGKAFQTEGTVSAVTQNENIWITAGTRFMRPCVGIERALGFSLNVIENNLRLRAGQWQDRLTSVNLSVCHIEQVSSLLILLREECIICHHFASFKTSWFTWK